MPQQNKIDYINNLIKPKNLVGIDRTNIPVFEIIEEKKETKAQEVSKYQIIKEFVEQVERRTENKMLITGKLEGAHYAAMKEILAELEKGEQDG